MRTTVLQRTALACAITLLAHTAALANGIQMQIPDAPGSSTINGFENSIDVTSFQWGVGVGISNVSSSTPREVSTPALSEITWTQALDKSYGGLTKSMFTANRFSTTTSFVGGGRQAPSTYLTMQTEVAAISGLSISSGDGPPSISASLAFRSFSLGYQQPNPDGSVRTAAVAYDGFRNEVTGDTSRAPVSGGIVGPASGLYLRLGAGTNAIAGDSADFGYENWIKLDTFQMGVGRRLLPTSDGFDLPFPSVSELTVTYSLDGATPAILSNLMRGRSIGQATLELVRNGSAGAVTAMQLELDNVMFSGLSFSSGGERPSVSTSLNFTGYQQTIWDIRSDGTRGTPISFGWDIAIGKEREAPSALSTAGFGAGSLAPVAAVPIPEPQTWALLAGGIALLALHRRRRLQG